MKVFIWPLAAQRGINTHVRVQKKMQWVGEVSVIVLPVFQQ